MMMGFGGFGLILLFFFFVMVIGIAFALVNFLFPRATNLNSQHRIKHYPSAVAGTTPLEILNQRYASGELTKEEYTTMKDDILAASL